MTTIKGTGISFQKGGLHRSLGVPEGQKIPENLMAEALSGKRGPKAKKQAQLARTMEGFDHKRSAARKALY